MFTNINPLNRNGRLRFGSSIFIDIRSERIVDSLAGNRRQRYILYFGIILLVLKILTANLEGIVFTILVFYPLYFLSEKQISHTITDFRVLSITKYKYPNQLRIMSYLLFAGSIISLIKLINPYLITTYTTRDDVLNYIGDLLNIFPLIFHQYTLFFNQYKFALIQFDALISLSIYLWMSILFFQLHYEFSEVNHSQISDQLVTIDHKSRFLRIFGLHIIDFILLFVVFNGISIFFIIIIIVLHLAIPKTTFSELKYFGSSGRQLLPTLEFNHKEENHKLIIITSVIFNWRVYANNDDKFPANLIPNEVANFYDTGLRASLINALNSGNNIGLIFGIIINTYVIYELFYFYFQINSNSDILTLVIGVSVGLVSGMIILWVSLRVITKYRYKFQKDERLMLGKNFVGRWIEPNLWIIKGDMLEGMSRNKNRLQKLLQYERVSGMRIAWITLIIITVLTISLSFIIFWISLGALNISRSIFIFPFLFNLGFNFITTSAKLNFFIISSFIIWIFIYTFYPRIYASTRPQMVIDLKHLSTLSVILRDTESHHNAIAEFTKCIIYSSRKSRRHTPGRPGYFILDIDLVGYWSNNEIDIQFEFGSSARKSKIVNFNSTSYDDKLTLMKNYYTSAIKGYPSIEIKVIEANKKILLIADNHELDGEDQILKTFNYQGKLSFTLKFNILATYN